MQGPPGETPPLVLTRWMNVVPVSRSPGSLEEPGAGPTGTSSQGIFLAGSSLFAGLTTPFLLTALPSASFFHVGPTKCWMTCLLSVRQLSRGDGPRCCQLPVGARVGLHALGVADQEGLVTGGWRRGCRRGLWRGVGHLRHGQGGRGHGDAYAHGAAETGKSGHSRINSEKVGTGSFHATDTGQVRGWEVLTMAAPRSADRAGWASLRGERRLIGTNAGCGLIPVRLGWCDECPCVDDKRSYSSGSDGSTES